MEESQDKQVMNPLSAEETEVAYNGPAVSSNRCLVNIGPQGVRIAFVEQFSDQKPPKFRTAVVMPPQDAIAMKNLLSVMLKEIEDVIDLEKDGGKRKE